LRVHGGTGESRFHRIPERDEQTDRQTEFNCYINIACQTPDKNYANFTNLICLQNDKKITNQEKTA